MDVVSLNFLSAVDIRLSVVDIVSCEIPHLASEIVSRLVLADNSSYQEAVSCNGSVWSVKVCFNGHVALCINCNDPCAFDNRNEQTPHYLAPCQPPHGSSVYYQNSMHALVINMRQHEDYLRVISSVVVLFPDRLQIVVNLAYNRGEEHKLKCIAVDAEQSSLLSMQYIETLIDLNVVNDTIRGSSLEVNVSQLSSSTSYRVFCSIRSISGTIYWYQHSIAMYPDVYLPLSRTGSSILLDSKQSENLSLILRNVWNMSSNAQAQANSFLLMSIQESAGIRTTEQISGFENITAPPTPSPTPSPNASDITASKSKKNAHFEISESRRKLISKKSYRNYFDIQYGILYFEALLESLSLINHLTGLVFLALLLLLVYIAIVALRRLKSHGVDNIEANKQALVEKSDLPIEGDEVDENNISRIYLASDALATQQLGETNPAMEKPAVSRPPRSDPIMWSQSSNEFDRPSQPSVSHLKSLTALRRGDKSSLFSLLRKVSSSSDTDCSTGNRNILSCSETLNSISISSCEECNGGRGCPPHSILLLTSNCSSSTSDDHAVSLKTRGETSFKRYDFKGINFLCMYAGC